MRLLLDELWPYEIAAQLRRRGFDVVAANEPGQAARYAGIDDDLVFARVQKDGRAIVTDNVDDYEPERLAWEASGTPHFGVVYALDPPFNRHRPEHMIGQMVRALEQFLRSPAAQIEPLNTAHWLRPSAR